MRHALVLLTAAVAGASATAGPASVELPATSRLPGHYVALVAAHPVPAAPVRAGPPGLAPSR